MWTRLGVQLKAKKEITNGIVQASQNMIPFGPFYIKGAGDMQVHALLS